MRKITSFIVLLWAPWILVTANCACHAQTTMLPSIIETLAHPVQPPAVTQYQLQTYLLGRIPALPLASTPELWSAEVNRLRKHILDDVAFHGWPREWVESAPNFQEMGVIESGHGYRIRKLRYEIVPGFMSTALLYEPEEVSGRMPAVLNLIGHEPAGTAVEYEQKRCINLAKRGILALNLGWMEFGELSQPENAHDYAAHLDLAGSNALGLFYLAMRRGLDYLAASQKVDPARIGVTGLSGGGWQTVVLSALDPRVAVSVEVAGLASKESNLTNPGDTYEIEEDAPDLMQGFDYPELIALRAPKPTLLEHNAVDSCCFRAQLVKPYIYEAVKPYFQMYGAQGNLGWHENLDPGVHNYQLDNRIQAYRFFTEHFHLPVVDNEIFSDGEIHTAQELAAGIPTGNQTVLGLARSMAAKIRREPTPGSGEARALWMQTKRAELKSVVRYQPVKVDRALRMANSRGMGFRSLSYRFDLSNALSATGIWFKQEASPSSEPVTIVLNDKGYQAAGEQVFQSLSSGHEVLALDVLFNGATRPELPDSSGWELLVDSSGDRSLGLEVAQVLAVAHWLRTSGEATEIKVETDGIRNEVIAAVAAALDPGAFTAVTSQNGMKILGYLLEKPVSLRDAPELFCLDLYKDFDIDLLGLLSAPTKVVQARVAGN